MHSFKYCYIEVCVCVWCVATCLGPLQMVLLGNPSSATTVPNGALRRVGQVECTITPMKGEGSVRQCRLYFTVVVGNVLHF